MSLEEMNHLGGAAGAYREVVEFDLGDANAWYKLGIALEDHLVRLRVGLYCYEKAVVLGRPQAAK